MGLKEKARLMAPYPECIGVQLYEGHRGRHICRRLSSQQEQPGCRRWRPTGGPSLFCRWGSCGSTISMRVCLFRFTCMCLQSLISKFQSLILILILVCVFKVALNNVLVDLTLSFQLLEMLFVLNFYIDTQTLRFVFLKKKCSPPSAPICFEVSPPWRLTWHKSSVIIWWPDVHLVRQGRYSLLILDKIFLSRLVDVWKIRQT